MNRPIPSERKASVLSRVVVLLVLFSLPLLFLGVGCNNYPIDRLRAQTFTEVTDETKLKTSLKVDILFVVDNSGSMGEEQAKLKANFKGFIESLISKEVNDFQIGVITTDMDNIKQAGRLQGNPAIIKGKDLTADKIIEYFTNNTNVGIDGSPYEKGLEAMRAALSPNLLNADNKGFLRDDSLLAVIFVGDEDDCSHSGTIPEGEYLSDVCYLPPTQILKDQDGKPVLDSQNKEIRGQMDKLYKVQDRYINFLKGLNRDVILSGLIGNPNVMVDDPANPGQKRLIDPPGSGCQQDISCKNGNEEHFCGFMNLAGQRQCGGCKSADANARIPGFRFFEVIKAFADGDGSNLWFPICGDNDKFKDALLRFAGAIIDKLNFVILSKTPSIDPQGKPYLQVTIIQPDGKRVPLQYAPRNQTKCKQDSDCGGDFVCGRDEFCYGDGWVYFKPITGDPQPKIKLSGSAKSSSIPGSNIAVSYAASK